MPASDISSFVTTNAQLRSLTSQPDPLATAVALRSAYQSAIVDTLSNAEGVRTVADLYLSEATQLDRAIAAFQSGAGDVAATILSQIPPRP